jgi:hypothetical protein
MKYPLKIAMNQVVEELRNSRSEFPPFNSRHEAIAVIREEYLELERCVFTKGKEHLAYSEAVQLAAMALRMILECEQVPPLE